MDRWIWRRRCKRMDLLAHIISPWWPAPVSRPFLAPPSPLCIQPCLTGAERDYSENRAGGPINQNRQRADSNNVAAIYSSKIIKSNPILNKFLFLPGTPSLIIIYGLIRIKWNSPPRSHSDVSFSLSVIMPQDGPSPFPSWKAPLRCLARGSERPGWCAAPRHTAPVWAERRPGCLNISPGNHTPPPPLPPCRHRYHLYRHRTTTPLTFNVKLRHKHTVRKEAKRFNWINYVI